MAESTDAADMVDMAVRQYQQGNIGGGQAAQRQLRGGQVVGSQLQNGAKAAQPVSRTRRHGILCISWRKAGIDQHILARIGADQKPRNANDAPIGMDLKQPEIQYRQADHLPLDETCRIRHRRPQRCHESRNSHPVSVSSGYDGGTTRSGGRPVAVPVPDFGGFSGRSGPCPAA